MAFEKRGYNFSTLGSESAVLERALLLQIVHEDASLLELHRASGVSDAKKYCAYIKKSSFAALQASPQMVAMPGAGTT